MLLEPVSVIFQSSIKMDARESEPSKQKALRAEDRRKTNPVVLRAIACIESQTSSSLRALYQPEKGDENDRAYDCGNERSDQSASSNAKHAEQPAADHRADYADNDVADEAIAAPFMICPASQPATAPITKKMIRPETVTGFGPPRRGTLTRPGIPMRQCHTTVTLSPSVGARAPPLEGTSST